MTPETASASRPDLNLDSLRVYFLYEDHIGRPVLMSEYEDYDSDGSYFTDDNANDYPYFHATYDPFGSINEDFDSTGIVVGNNNDTKITWSVPFRFPGQYQDPELEGVIYYNWNRYYSPAIGRYNRADPIFQQFLFAFTSEEISDYQPIIYQYIPHNLSLIYPYALNNPITGYDEYGLGLITCFWYSRKVAHARDDCRDELNKCEKADDPDLALIDFCDRYDASGIPEAMITCVCRKAGGTLCYKWLKACGKAIANPPKPIPTPK